MTFFLTDQISLFQNIYIKDHQVSILAKFSSGEKLFKVSYKGNLPCFVDQIPLSKFVYGEPMTIDCQSRPMLLVSFEYCFSVLLLFKIKF